MSWCPDFGFRGTYRPAWPSGSNKLAILEFNTVRHSCLPSLLPLPPLPPLPAPPLVLASPALPLSPPLLSSSSQCCSAAEHTEQSEGTNEVGRQHRAAEQTRSTRSRAAQRGEMDMHRAHGGGLFPAAAFPTLRSPRFPPRRAASPVRPDTGWRSPQPRRALMPANLGQCTEQIWTAVHQNGPNHLGL